MVAIFRIQIFFCCNDTRIAELHTELEYQCQ
jgi:hypothetical protein